MKKGILVLFLLFFSVLFLCSFVSAIPTPTTEFISCSLSGIPSEVVRGQRYDVTIQARYRLNKEDAFNSGNCLNALLNFNVQLWEYDLFFDDFVSEASFNPMSFSLTSVNCKNNYMDITTIAKNVPLSRYEDLLGGAQFEGYIVRDLVRYSDGYCVTNLKQVSFIDSECYDLTTHNPKSYGSQPTGYTDDTDGFCSGNTQPLGTSYIKTVDYYCDGIHTYKNSKETTVATCGPCNYCSDNKLTCNYYSTGTSCDNGGKVCDGVGTCTCLNNFYSQCFGGDVYWFDSCGIRRDKKQSCGTAGCNLETNKCNDCQITCASNSNCGTNSFVGNPVCQNGNVFQNYITHTCNNPGTCSASCLSTTNLQLKQTCSSGQSCSDGQCYNSTQPTLTRTPSSTTVNPNSTFTLNYTVTGASGTWGNSIEDNVIGGCSFSSGSTQYKSVMLSEDGNTKSITITAPSSGTLCTFSGSYQFGTLPVVNMPNSVVNIANCLNSDDTDCDGKISRTELGAAITGWIQGSVSRSQLGVDIQSWSQS